MNIRMCPFVAFGKSARSLLPTHALKTARVRLTVVGMTGCGGGAEFEGLNKET
jgi:hypothetical protein